MLPFLLIIAGASDFLSYRIPNWLTAATALAFFPMAFMTGMGGEVILWHIAAGFLLLAVGFALFAGGIFGGGDAKLMAAAGLWFGWAQLMPFLVYTALAGGLLAIAVGVWSLFHMEIEVREATPGRSAGSKSSRTCLTASLSPSAAFSPFLIPGGWGCPRERELRAEFCKGLTLI